MTERWIVAIFASMCAARACGDAFVGSSTHSPFLTLSQVVERIKQGFSSMLPSICVEIHSKSGSQPAYGMCQNVLAGFSVWGANLRQWLQHGEAAPLWSAFMW